MALPGSVEKLRKIVSTNCLTSSMPIAERDSSKMVRYMER